MGRSGVLGFLRRINFPPGGARHDYSALPDGHLDGEGAAARAAPRPSPRRPDRHRSGPAALKSIMAAMSLVAVGYLVLASTRGARASPRPTCETPELGYQCWPSVARLWGQYSPYFSVPSEIDAAVPPGCDITFAQVLSRHAARDPTARKSQAYADLIGRIHSSVAAYGPGFEFVRDYAYALGADQLTAFGRQEMASSGAQFYGRYRALARSEAPFVRASGQERVVESARRWAEGLHRARAADAASAGPDGFPWAVLAIPEGAGVNNTLSHGACAAFEDGPDLGAEAQAAFRAGFAPPVAARLNAHLPGANLSGAEAVALMDLCPFGTVAAPGGAALSPFCALFTEDEWRAYDYHGTLGKYYGSGPGSPLGPTQGVGWVNELVARLTGRAVDDHTSSNATLDGDPATFPLGRRLYADFSHDKDMTGVFAALGLHAGTAPLPRTARSEPAANGGYASSWTVPFAARLYVEKMACGAAAGAGEELVRVLLNGRVVPLQGCGADELGRCAVGRFVESLGFARAGGRWDLCSA